MLFSICLMFIDIRDDTGVLAESLIDKYLVGADRRNFNSMIPGLTDVCDYVSLVLTDKLAKKCNQQMNY